MALGRRVLGGGSSFKITGRSIAGKNQVAAPTVTPTANAPAIPDRPDLAVPQGTPFAVAPVFQSRYEGGPVLGWQAEVDQGIPTHNPFPASAPLSFGDVARGAGNTEWTQATQSNWLTNAAKTPASHSYTDDSPYGPAYTPKAGETFGPTSPITSNDRSADDRLKQRVMAQAAEGYTPSKEEILGYTQTAINDFNTERARLEALRDGALADGLEEVADQYDAQIRAEQRAIGKLQDEIALTGDIEGWYRKRIQAPYEEAKRAAEEVDLQSTLAIHDKFKNEQANELAATEARLEGVLADLGFTPDQITAMRSDRAADNEVTAAQNMLLEASGVREGELDWEKKLRWSMAEEELQNSNRQSAGREMIVAERNREAIADREVGIDELINLKDKAMARVKRAVDRNFQGAEFPEREEFVNAAMAAMENDLIGDLSPNEQDWFRSVVSELIADGVPFSKKKFQELLLSDRIYVAGHSEALDGIQDKWRAYARQHDLPEAEVQQDMFAEMRGYVENADILDPEDIGILTGITSTYRTANEEYDRYQEDRSKMNYSNANNRDPQNIADAKAGVGVYGERKRLVASMVPVIEQMWGGMITRVEGQNYLRPVPTEKVSGQAMNSDHLTAGALDVFMPPGSAKHAAYYRDVMVPQLKRWQNEGLISSWVGYGANKAHADHVHISFALGANNDQGFNAQTVAQHDDHTNHDHQAHVDQPTADTRFYGRGGM